MHFHLPSVHGWAPFANLDNQRKDGPPFLSTKKRKHLTDDFRKNITDDYSRNPSLSSLGLIPLFFILRRRRPAFA